MAYDNDFIPGEEEEATNGIVFMGVTLSPPILGVILAVLGIGGGVWLAYQFVQPLLSERQDLQVEIAEKETQIDAQGNVQEQIERAEAEREEVQELQQDVLSMFATPDSLETLLLDINQQVNQRNANLSADEIRTRLVDRGCPAGLLEDFTNVNERVNGFFSEVSLEEFTPVFPGNARGQTNAANITADGYELVTDGSFGRQANEQIKRQTYQVRMQGNFAQTRTVLEQLERLQPLLVVRRFQSRQETPTFIYDENGLLANCQPETSVTTSFKLEALLPLSQEELQQRLQDDEVEEEES
ncbi:hypothetical protein NEA10_06035 [Phormidium yuhuli AB48]|uniref:Type IV pilus assembly protein PilO n=1 Tax=Phormidium yuhuli AB48 TaxID=2940671 RepID=A0ABY5AST1_9CYAN|nr:hypothetical protein [Phormidium yuhuli]USR92280.1 hypothetical protein NEA10_06035 [Phormidium yuhuli AB48]